MSWYQFHFGDFARSFISVLFEGIPFLLLGSLIAGFVDVFVSNERVTRLLPKKTFPAVCLSAFLGFLFPICECGSVVVVRRFIRKGLNPAAGITYMLAAPILNPVVLLSTWMAFSGTDSQALMTGLRFGLGGAIAIATGLIIAKLSADRWLQPSVLAPEEVGRRTGLRVSALASVPSAEDADGNGGTPSFADLLQQASLPRKLLLAVQSATADFLDVTFYFVIGTAITASFFSGVHFDALEPLATHAAGSVASLMGMAALLAQCSNTDAFIAATQFIVFPFAAKLAFLVYGPLFDLKLVWLYGLVAKRKYVTVFGLSLFFVIFFVCWQLARAEVGDPRRDQDARPQAESLLDTSANRSLAPLQNPPSALPSN
jgi:uncharacterized membrane protein YraQ (UPF0718 family)